ncbi:unnamed protein product, partial [Staurois parvus]
MLKLNSKQIKRKKTKEKTKNKCINCIIYLPNLVSAACNPLYRLTIWKLGHCPRARDAPGTFFIGFFEFGQGHRGPMIPYCPG